MTARDRHPKLPLVILAGGAHRDERVPGQKDRIIGPKGWVLRVGDRPLIDLVVERFAACGAFDRLLIVGPASTYGERRGVAEVVDSDGEFAQNIQAGLEAAVGPKAQGCVAFTTCDLVPELDELERVMADYYEHAPLLFWYPAIRVPDQAQALGASAYKRQYRLRPEGSKEAVAILPGHLVMVDVGALRSELINEAFEIAYRTRTKRIWWRFLNIVARVAKLLIAHDLRCLMRFRRPLLTLEVMVHAVPLAVGLAVGGISQRAIENRLRALFATWKSRRAHPERRGRIPIIEALSLARDIDTRGEAEERQMELVKAGASLTNPARPTK